jgi:hypothetical protein
LTLDEQARLMEVEGEEWMNEVVQEIWTELGAESDPDARGFAELTEEPALENEAFLRAIAGLIRWLRVGFAAGRRRPSPLFFEVLFSRGRAACTAVLDRYLEQAPDPGEGLSLWRALAPAARLARNRGFVNWDLDSWRPGAGADSTKVRLVGHIPRDLDEKARRLAFETRQTLSALVESALAERIEKHEKRHGPLAVREAAQAVAS